MSDKISARRKIMAVLERAAAKLDKGALKSLAQDWAKALDSKVQAYQAGEKAKNIIAQDKLKEIESIASEAEVLKTVSWAKNARTAIQKIDAAYSHLFGKLNEMAQGMEENSMTIERVIGGLDLYIDRVPEKELSGSDVAGKLKPVIESMRQELEEMEATFRKATKAGDKAFEKIPSQIKVRVEKLENALKAAHSGAIPTESKPPKEKDAPKKKDVTKVPQPEKGLRTNLQGTPKTAAEEPDLAELENLADEWQAAADEFLAEMDAANEPMAAAAESAQEMQSLLESLPMEEEAPEAAPEDEEPGFLDKML